MEEEKWDPKIISHLCKTNTPNWNKPSKSKTAVRSPMKMLIHELKREKLRIKDEIARLSP